MSDNRLTYTIRINIDPETAGKNVDAVKASLESLGVTVEKISPGGRGPRPADPIANSATQARLAVTGLSQSLSDSGQFMYGFRAGMISIGNNLDMVARSLVALKAESAAAGTTMRASLLSVLTGPSGVLLGISAFITALTVLPGLIKDSAKAAEEAAEGGLKQFAELLHSFSPEARQTVSERIARAIRGTEGEIAGLTKFERSIDPLTGGEIITSHVLPADKEKVALLEKRLGLLRQYEETAKKVGEEAAALLSYERQTAILTGDKLSTVQTLQAEIKRLQDLQKKGDVFTEDADGKQVRVADLIAEKQEQIKRIQETTAETRKRRAEEDAARAKEGLLIVREMAKEGGKITYVSDEQKERLERMFELAQFLSAWMKQSPETRRELVRESNQAWLKGQAQQKGVDKPTEGLVRGITPQMEIEIDATKARLATIGGTLSTSISSGIQRGFAEGENFLDGFVNAVLESILSIAAQQAAIAGAAGLISLFSGIEFGAIAGSLGSVFAMADGGVIREPVAGIGMRSGQRYVLGERGDELVVPLNRSVAIAASGGSSNDAIIRELRELRSELRHKDMEMNIGDVVGEAKLVRRNFSYAERAIAKRRK